MLITYFTSWVNDGDVLNFREDVYAHDEVMAKKMFLNAIETTQLKAKKEKIAAKKDSSAAKKKAVDAEKKKMSCDDFF